MENLDYLSLLNPAQREAVTADPGNLLVLAGAGSGKTRVLVYRIAWLLQNTKISPANILAVTFTNKAAREMRTRLEELLQIPMQVMWVGTFHGLAHRLLRTHWNEAGLKQTFQIIDSDDQYRIIRSIQKNLDFDESKWPVKQTQWFINNKKDAGIRSKSIQKTGDLFNDTLNRVYSSYEEMCEKNNLVDFAELLLRSHELLLNNSELLGHYQERFQHILVDEFQDTNTIQYAWIRLLSGKGSNVTAVGDDDQSIYGWRGARIENIHKLSQDLPDTKTIRLEQNYRSTANILEAANAVIANNRNRLGKNLWTEGNKGELITLYGAFNETDEARYVVSSIAKHLKEGNARGDIAILYRSNAQSRVLEEQLLQAGIPYRVYGGVRFFDRAEVKYTMAYLRLVNNREDDSAFDRIVNFPTRGIGNTSLNTVKEYAKEHNLSFWDAAKLAIDPEGNIEIPTRTRNAINAFIKLIDDTGFAVKQLNLGEQIEHILHCTNLRAHFTKDKTDQGRARLENLDELISAAKEFEINNEEESALTVLQAFLAHAALEAGETQADVADNSVQLMTLHSAKGLEFPVVFLTGLEAGLFPHHLSTESEHGLEEERRLCYVGMTRAMQKLYLTYAQSRRMHGTETYKLPSMFLKEIPKELVDEFQPMMNILRPQKIKEKSYKPRLSMEQPGAINRETNLSIGQTVSHKKFGEGVVLGFEGSGEATRVQVKFKQVGTKWLVAAFAKLETA